MSKENKTPKNNKPKIVKRPYDVGGFFAWIRQNALPSISLSVANVVHTIAPKSLRISNYGYESPSYQPKEMDWGSYIGAGQTFVQQQGMAGYAVALLPVTVDGKTYHPAGVTSHTLKLLGLAAGVNFISQTVGMGFTLSDADNTFEHHYFVADTGSAWLNTKFPNMGTIDIYARDHTHYAYNNITDPGIHSTLIPLKITVRGRIKPIKWLPGLIQYDTSALLSWMASRPKKLALYNAFLNTFR